MIHVDQHSMYKQTKNHCQITENKKDNIVCNVLSNVLFSKMDLQMLSVLNITLFETDFIMSLKEVTFNDSNLFGSLMPAIPLGHLS